MPRKRRKAIASIETPEIPYPKVRVEWIDCVSDSGWATDKEFDRMKLAKPVNEGWLYSKDKTSVKLFHYKDLSKKAKEKADAQRKRNVRKKSR